MNVAEFVVGTSSHLSSVRTNQQPLEVQRRNRDHVTVVPTELWREAEQALDLVRGLKAMGVTLDEHCPPEQTSSAA